MDEKEGKAVGKESIKSSQYYEDLFNRLSLKRTKEKTEKTKKKLVLHRSIHNFHTIKWLRRKLGIDTIIGSIYTLIPNNGIPLNIDENRVKTQSEKRKEFLDNYLKKNKKIFTLDPHYMFTNETLNKIYKLRDIFLEFDEDGSRKLEMEELEQMFKTNNIETNLNNLCNLFFSDSPGGTKQKSQEDLNFYEFLEFALSSSSDQSFRNFMRNLKDTMICKLKEDKENTLESEPIYYSKHKETFRTTFNENDSYDDKFLPMNFNLVLDYFNKKGKVRELENKILNSIANMNLFKNSISKTIPSINSISLNNKNRKSSLYYNEEKNNDFSKDKSTNSENDDDFDVNNLDNHFKINIDHLFNCFKSLFNQKRPREQISNINIKHNKKLNKINSNNNNLIIKDTLQQNQNNKRLNVNQTSSKLKSLKNINFNKTEEIKLIENINESNSNSIETNTFDLKEKNHIEEKLMTTCNLKKEQYSNNAFSDYLKLKLKERNINNNNNNIIRKVQTETGNKQKVKNGRNFLQELNSKESNSIKLDNFENFNKKYISYESESFKSTFNSINNYKNHTSNFKNLPPIKMKIDRIPSFIMDEI